MFALHLVHGMHPELFEEKVILLRAVSTEFENNCCLILRLFLLFLLERRAPCLGGLHSSLENKFAYAWVLL